MKQKIYLIILLFLTIDCNQKPKEIQNILLTNEIKRETLEKLPADDIALFNTSENLYKSKKFNDSLKSLEILLKKYRNEKLFYLYGNILTALSRYDEAIISFTIASEFHSSRPELSLYNIACIYSIQNKKNEALDYLERAIDRGYNNFNYIENDTDLKNLRSSELWKEKREYLISRLIHFKKENLIGTLRYFTLGASDFSFLCENNTFVNANECNSITNKEIYFGVWKLEANSIRVELNRRCKSNGIGLPIESTECGEKYKTYQTVQCENINDKWTISRSELAKAFGRKYKDMDPSEDEFGYQHKKFNINPIHCESGYHPTNPEDLDLSKYFE